MRGGVGGRPVAAAGRVQPFAVAEHADAPRLVVGDEAAHAIAELIGDHVDVLDEGVDGGAVGPAARVLERLRQVPVVERDERLDAGLEQPVDEPIVERQARRVRLPAPAREDARPGDREAVGAEAEPLHELDVLGPAVIVVAGDGTVAAVGDGAGARGEAIPDRFAAAVFVWTREDTDTHKLLVASLAFAFATGVTALSAWYSDTSFPATTRTSPAAGNRRAVSPRPALPGTAVLPRLRAART